MILDAWFVGRHELSGIRRAFVPSAGAMLTLVFVLALFGVVVPVSLASGWLNTTAYFFLWLWLAWIVTAGPISDSFAGERERHTLDALFATRLSCCSILIGKIGAVTLYGLALSLVALSMSAVVNFAFGSGWSGELEQPVKLGVTVALTPVAVMLASTAGALISLNARTARQAHQATIVVLPGLMLIGLVLSRVAGAVAPVAYQEFPNRVLPLFRTPAAIGTAGTAMALCAAALFILAAVRLKHIRVVPS